MRKNITKLLIISMIAIFALSACAKKEETIEIPMVSVPESTYPVEKETNEATKTEANDLYPVGSVEETTGGEIYPVDGIDFEALILEKIGDNHTLDFILSQDKTAEEWGTTIDRMIGYGAKISSEEKQLIIDWLVSRN